jgi:myo-inositol-1-phosphate synthase
VAVLAAPPGCGKIGALFTPQQSSLVKPSKLRQGIASAKQQLDETLDELLRTTTGPYEIKEIKLVASFSADGKFLGFGVGGAASMEITICPSAEG